MNTIDEGTWHIIITIVVVYYAVREYAWWKAHIRFMEYTKHIEKQEEEPNEETTRT